MFLISGKQVPGPAGIEIVNPLTAPTWAKLDGRDYQSRKTRWIRKIIIHTTKGKTPQMIIPGVGAAGRDKVVADFWRGDPQHSAAQIVIGSNGRVACLCDLFTTSAFHAGYANDDSIGIEIYQEANGGIYQAALFTLGEIVVWLCEYFGIPRQMPHRYIGTVIPRLAARDGGPDVVGVFGHRDQSWVYPEKLTPEERRRSPQGRAGRGAGDPGDFPFEVLDAKGFERLNFTTSEDLVVARRRQQILVSEFSEKIAVDGLWGPASQRAMLKHGFRHGRELDAITA